MTTRIAAVDAAGFDPTEGRFIAQDSRPSNWGDVVPAHLTPLMRALLVIDGTVTKILEAYFLESVDVRRLHQSVDILEQSDRWLGAEVGESTVNRAVMLVGSQSGRMYTYAESRIVVNRLSGRMQSRLDDELFGLGRILLDSNVENRRECLWYGQEKPASIPGPVAEHGDAEFVSRTYRIIVGGRPLMSITERFPLDLAY